MDTLCGYILKELKDSRDDIICHREDLRHFVGALCTILKGMHDSRDGTMGRYRYRLEIYVEAERRELEYDRHYQGSMDKLFGYMQMLKGLDYSNMKCSGIVSYTLLVHVDTKVDIIK